MGDVSSVKPKIWAIQSGGEGGPVRVVGLGGRVVYNIKEILQKGLEKFLHVSRPPSQEKMLHGEKAIEGISTWIQTKDIETVELLNLHGKLMKQIKDKRIQAIFDVVNEKVSERAIGSPDEGMKYIDAVMRNLKLAQENEKENVLIAAFEKIGASALGPKEKIQLMVRLSHKTEKIQELQEARIGTLEKMIAKTLDENGAKRVWEWSKDYSEAETVKNLNALARLKAPVWSSAEPLAFLKHIHFFDSRKDLEYMYSMAPALEKQVYHAISNCVEGEGDWQQIEENLRKGTGENLINKEKLPNLA